ncbi:hypothetical protein EI94DRAFT_1707760 [Lactarius quietus]|nr:hypothetical protein EI94DRAFT_1707760 [Lactarius quietus]
MPPALSSPLSTLMLLTGLVGWQRNVKTIWLPHAPPTACKGKWLDVWDSMEALDSLVITYNCKTGEDIMMILTKAYKKTNEGLEGFLKLGRYMIQSTPNKKLSNNWSSVSLLVEMLAQDNSNLVQVVPDPVDIDEICVDDLVRLTQWQDQTTPEDIQQHDAILEIACKAEKLASASLQENAG